MLVLGMNSCTKKDTSLFDEELMAQRQKELIDTDESQVAANAKNIFGAAFGANQDWNMLSNGKVTINVNADMEDIAKVRIMAFGNAYNVVLRLILNHGMKAAECRSELSERRIFKTNKLFYLRNQIS